MSPDISCNICPEAKNRYGFLQRRSAAVLKCNSDAGCQLCSLLYHAFESFHESWFRECRDGIQFNRFSSINHSLRVDISLDQAPTDKREIIHAEFVYEELNLRPESSLTTTHNLKQLEGVYSPLEILPGREVPNLPERGINSCAAGFSNASSTTHAVRLTLSTITKMRNRRWDISENSSATTRKQWRTSKLCCPKSLMGKIDSLCIVQDDAIDWQIESSNMAGIYEKSYVTISANNSSALAGIVSRAQSGELGSYVADLRRNESAPGLFWFTDMVSSRDPPMKVVPSFPWASLAGTSKVKELHWQWWSPDDTVKQIFRIMEVHCPVASLNLYRIVSDAFVKLHGHVLTITLKNEQARLPFNSVVRSKTCSQRAIAFIDKYMITEITAERDFVCFFGFTWSQGSDNLLEAKQRVSALILEPVGIDVYQRKPPETRVALKDVRDMSSVIQKITVIGISGLTHCALFKTRMRIGLVKPQTWDTSTRTAALLLQLKQHEIATTGYSQAPTAAGSTWPSRSFYLATVLGIDCVEEYILKKLQKHQTRKFSSPSSVDTSGRSPAGKNFPLGKLEHPSGDHHHNYKEIYLSRELFYNSGSLTKEADIWYSLLEDFMSRATTNHADRLPALSGIAREIARLTGYRYVAGLWKEDIVAGLLWFTSATVTCDQFIPRSSSKANGRFSRV
ncbi:hypothetical protein G7Y89_g9277 [Cudoniella acicularis]|uniref:Heterokaryon incompatibility domain-containing protein n=1 Tax=Cudoniella acicularis TaxID=354080 RepID=A0A8H4RH71_9HELO|nr:hypothetical protein G7Y89_g9277 [Cudoniella acicularis]